jgi:hypothetical protein
MFEMRSIINYQETSNSLAMSNILYSSSTFEYSNSLLVFEHTEETSNFNVSINNVYMQSLNFTRTGNLFNFGHQAVLPIIMND